MGKNDVLSEKEVLKKLVKEEKDKKKNKKARRDAWTAVAVIATIMLLAVGLSFYKTSTMEIKEYSGKSLAKEHEKRENTKNVIIGLGIACTGVLVIALVNRSKNKVERISPEEMQRAEQRKLDAARERVEEARRNRLNEESNVTMTRGNRENMHSYSEGRSIGERRSMSDMDMEDREAYLERRKKEYQYYMENGMDDDEELDGNHKSKGNYVGRGKSNNNTKKKIIIGAVIAAVVVSITIIIVLL